MYLSYAMLRIELGVRLELLIKYMVGIERMGAAIDKGLEHIRGDAPRSASVLRAELRRIASRLVADGDVAAFMVAPTDLYEVQFTPYPVIAAPEAEGEEEAPEDPHDSTMDWLSELSYHRLLDAEGTLSVVLQIELCVFHRFDEAEAFKAKGVWEKFSSITMGAYGRDDITDMDFSPEVIESHRRVAEAMLNINASAASSARGPI